MWIGRKSGKYNIKSEEYQKRRKESASRIWKSNCRFQFLFLLSLLNLLHFLCYDLLYCKTPKQVFLTQWLYFDIFLPHTLLSIFLNILFFVLTFKIYFRIAHGTALQRLEREREYLETMWEAAEADVHTVEDNHDKLKEIETSLAIQQKKAASELSIVMDRFRGELNKGSFKIEKLKF